MPQVQAGLTGAGAVLANPYPFPQTFTGQVTVQPSSGSATPLVVNAAAGYGGSLLADYQNAGTSVFQILLAGGMIMGGGQKIRPTVDSTTAIGIANAGLTAAIFVVDTSNKRVGINKTPSASFDLDVNAQARVNAATAIPAGGSASAALLFSSTSSFGIYFGSGAPTVSAAQGSLYLRSDGAQNARVYVNTNGSTTWTTWSTTA